MRIFHFRKMITFEIIEFDQDGIDEFCCCYSPINKKRVDVRVRRTPAIVSLF